MSEPESIPKGGESVGTKPSTPSQPENQDTKSRWSAMAEFDAAEADMAQVQTRPVDAVRAEEEELLESSKPSRPPRDRSYQYPSINRLATGGVAKPKLSPEELAERMEKMKLKNEQLLARRLRTEADENQYREQEEARQIAREQQRIKMRQKKEDDSRIQNAIDREREQVRQKKLGKLLEWDVDKPSVDDDDALPVNQRYYNNFNRRGRGGGFEGRGRRGKGRGYGPSSHSDKQEPPQVEDTVSWPPLPLTDPSKTEEDQ